MIITSGKWVKNEAPDQEENAVPWPARPAKDAVQVASEESFPASDAPSWTVVTGTGAHPTRLAGGSSS
jgi:hypothetical protein